MSPSTPAAQEKGLRDPHAGRGAPSVRNGRPGRVRSPWAPLSTRRPGEGVRVPECGGAGGRQGEPRKPRSEWEEETRQASVELECRERGRAG